MSGYDCTELSLLHSSDARRDSTVISGEGCHYTISTNLGGLLKLIVAGRKKQDSIPVYDTLGFRIKTIPSPYPTLGGRLRSGFVMGYVLQSEIGIIPMSNTDIPMRANVLSYEFHHRTKTHKGNQDLKADGPLITADMQKVLAHLQNGDSILFDHIMVKYAKVSSEDIGNLFFLIRGEKSSGELKREAKRLAFRHWVEDIISATSIDRASKNSLPVAQKRLIGKWQIIDVTTDMAICGLQIDYCGNLPLCDQNNSIVFAKSGFFITDNSGQAKRYEVGLFNIDSIPFRLRLDTETFAYMPISRKICRLVWHNGNPDGSVWYRKLTFTLYRRGRRK